MKIDGEDPFANPSTLPLSTTEGEDQEAPPQPLKFPDSSEPSSAIRKQRIQLLNLGKTTTTGSVLYLYRDVWRRAFFKLKVQHTLRKIKDELLLFGTNHELADLNMHYKANIDELIDKKARKAEDFRQQTTTYFLAQMNFRCLLRPDGRFRKCWNILVSLMLIYTATLMPYRFAFYDSIFWDSWTILELSLDFLFMCDVCFNFFTIYTKEDGSVIVDHRKIAKRYLRSWFIIDLIASIPYTLFDLFVNNSQVNQPRYNTLLRIIRLPRLYKLFRLFRILKAFKNAGASEASVLGRLEEYLQLNSRMYKLMKFLGTVLVAVHVAACIWIFFARISDYTPDTWVIRNNFANSAEYHLYIASFYWTVTTMVTVGYGDITAGTSTEQVLAILWMFIGVGFYTFTIGSLSTFLMSIDTRESILTSKMGAVHELSRETGISKKTKEKIQLAIRYNTFRVGNVWDNSLFEELPKTLKYEVVTSMYGGAFKSFPFFSKRDMAFVVFVMPKLRPSTTGHDEYIYREGEYADSVYFITRGRVNFVLSTSEIVYKAYMRGSYIGEIELIKGLQREDNAQASGHTELLSLNKRDFFDMMDEFPMDAKEITRLALLRQKRNKLALLETRELLKLKKQLGNLTELAGRQQILLPVDELDEAQHDLESQCGLLRIIHLQDEAKETNKDMKTATTLMIRSMVTLGEVQKRLNSLADRIHFCRRPMKVHSGVQYSI